MHFAVLTELKTICLFGIKFDSKLSDVGSYYFPAHFFTKGKSSIQYSTLYFSPFRQFSELLVPRSLA